MGKISGPKIRGTDSKWALENMFHITSHQENANGNYNEMSLFTL